MPIILVTIFAILVSLTGFTIDLTIIFGTAAEVPGPSLTLFNNPKYYTCTINRYVSATGNGTNNGLTVGSPWDLQTAAAANLGGGTCINVAPGVYNYTTVGELDMQHGGSNATKTGHVVWRCTTMPFSFSNGVLQGEGNGCILRNNDTTVGHFNYLVRFQPGSNYIIWDGFEFDGAGTGNGATTPTFGTVVCFDNENDPTLAIAHHIWILNSDAHHCYTSGIDYSATDWGFMIHNVYHDNSFGDCVMNSGLNIFEPAGLASYSPTAGNTDYWVSSTTGFTYHYVIAYNVGYHNYNPQGACGAGANTDGEGIILDTLSWGSTTLPTNGSQAPYNNPMLVMGNIMYNNGGNGIEVYSMLGSADPDSNGGPNTSTAHITFANNTTYSNDWDTHNVGSFRGNIDVAADQNVSVFNNVSYEVTQAGVATACGCTGNNPFLGQNGITITTNSWANNQSFPLNHNNFGGGNTYPTPSNADGNDPKFVNASTSSPNFALQAGSPAIGFGKAFDLWQQSGTVDAGACVSSLTSCP